MVINKKCWFYIFKMIFDVKIIEKKTTTMNNNTGNSLVINLVINLAAITMGGDIKFYLIFLNLYFYT
jgi:hypothetical protein